MAGFDEIALSLKEQVEKIGFQDVQDDIKRIHQTTVTAIESQASAAAQNSLLEKRKGQSKRGGLLMTALHSETDNQKGPYQRKRRQGEGTAENHWIPNPGPSEHFTPHKHI